MPSVHQPATPSDIEQMRQKKTGRRWGFGAHHKRHITPTKGNMLRLAFNQPKGTKLRLSFQVKIGLKYFGLPKSSWLVLLGSFDHAEQFFSDLQKWLSEWKPRERG